MTKLEKIRGEIEQLKSRHAEVEQATPPRDEILAELDKEIDRQARDATPATRNLAKPADLRHALQVQSDVPALGLICSMAPALVREYFINKIDAALQVHPAGLPADARRAALDQLDRALFTAQVEEERTIIKMEKAGERIHRRANLDPVAWREAYPSDVEAAATLTPLIAEAHGAKAAVDAISGEIKKLRDERRDIESNARQHRVAEDVGRGITVTQTKDGPPPDVEDKLKRIDEKIALYEGQKSAAEERWRVFEGPAARLRGFAGR